MKNLRTPKGTLDLSPTNAQIQMEFIEKVKKIYHNHNGKPIITPTFELRDVLCNKYGAESKLIFNLEDQGGDICSLRYDLTVPFARFLVMNRINKMRRYQIGSVFRRDNPSFETGRLREFVQADFDICGEGQIMVNDAEVLKMADDILKLVKRKYMIRVNDRRIISGMLIGCGIEENMHSTVCSTIDKSDKMCINDILAELSEKGLSDEQRCYIKEYIEYKGSNENKLKWIEDKMKEKKIESEEIKIIADGKDNNINAAEKPIESKRRDLLIESCLQSVKEISILFDYLKIFGVDSVCLDFSLARGLDYYTGMIFEAVFPDSKIGSVIGGGRYDNLTQQFSNHRVPCVGFSVGISRICTAIEYEKRKNGIFVGSLYGLLLKERLELLNILWNEGFVAETFNGKRVNSKEQCDYAVKNGFYAIIFIGENEIKNGKAVFMKLGENMEKKEIDYFNIVKYIKDLENI